MTDDKYAEARAAADELIGLPDLTWTCGHPKCFRQAKPVGPYYSGHELNGAVREHLAMRHS